MKRKPNSELLGIWLQSNRFNNHDASDPKTESRIQHRVTNRKTEEQGKTWGGVVDNGTVEHLQKFRLMHHHSGSDARYTQK